MSSLHVYQLLLSPPPPLPSPPPLPPPPCTVVCVDDAVHLLDPFNSLHGIANNSNHSLFIFLALVERNGELEKWSSLRLFPCLACRPTGAALHQVRDKLIQYVC